MNHRSGLVHPQSSMGATRESSSSQNRWHRALHAAKRYNMGCHLMQQETFSSLVFHPGLIPEPCPK